MNNADASYFSNRSSRLSDQDIEARGTRNKSREAMSRVDQFLSDLSFANDAQLEKLAYILDRHVRKHAFEQAEKSSAAYIVDQKQAVAAAMDRSSDTAAQSQIAGLRADKVVVDEHVAPCWRDYGLDDRLGWPSTANYECAVTAFKAITGREAGNESAKTPSTELAETGSITREMVATSLRETLGRERYATMPLLNADDVEAAAREWAASAGKRNEDEAIATVRKWATPFGKLGTDEAVKNTIAAVAIGASEFISLPSTPAGIAAVRKLITARTGMTWPSDAAPALVEGPAENVKLRVECSNEAWNTPPVFGDLDKALEKSMAALADMVTKGDDGRAFLGIPKDVLNALKASAPKALEAEAPVEEKPVYFLLPLPAGFEHKHAALAEMGLEVKRNAVEPRFGVIVPLHLGWSTKRHDRGTSIYDAENRERALVRSGVEGLDDVVTVYRVDAPMF